jgi:hypothetical protein
MEIKRYCAYDKLLGLALQIIEIHRDITTFNAHKSDYALPTELANQRAQELYRLLVHSITCLHHRQRDKSAEGSYLSEEEDNTTALNLIQQILPLPEYSLCESELVIFTKSTARSSLLRLERSRTENILNTRTRVESSPSCGRWGS